MAAPFSLSYVSIIGVIHSIPVPCTCMYDAWMHDACINDAFFLLPTNKTTDKARYMYDVCMMQERVMLVSMFA